MRRWHGESSRRRPPSSCSRCSSPALFVGNGLYLLTHGWFVRAEYARPGFPDDAFGMETPERTRLAEVGLYSILPWHRDGIERLARGAASTTARLAFDGRELRHMRDVRRLLSILLGLHALCLVVARRARARAADARPRAARAARGRVRDARALRARRRPSARRRGLVPDRVPHRSSSRGGAGASRTPRRCGASSPTCSGATRRSCSACSRCCRRCGVLVAWCAGGRGERRPGSDPAN